MLDETTSLLGDIGMAALSARLSRQVFVMLDGSLITRATTGTGSRTVVIPLPAEVDVVNCGQVPDAVSEYLRGGATVLIADATQTTFCDCAGVGALINAHQQSAAAGARLRVAASPAMRRMLRLTGVNRLLAIYPTVDAALYSRQPADCRG
jgi:anti-sigma B factor antagonist